MAIFERGDELNSETESSGNLRWVIIPGGSKILTKHDFSILRNFPASVALIAVIEVRMGWI